MFTKYARLTTRTLGGASAIALMCTGGAVAQQADTPAPTAAASSSIDEVIVTAQRRAESAQDVPIAITAFSEKMLDAQRIDGGSELVRAVPNVNFNKGYFAGFNFQIRGVGTQLGTAAGDAGVGLHLNNVPLTSSRFFEAEFYDTQRVEVLRGPQGTLYGRNATGGVVNVVTAPPSNEFEGEVSVEAASFDTRRARAMVNIPIADDKLAVRLAGPYLSRSGFGENTTLGGDVNGRDLWSTRATITTKPVDGVEATLIWQHFDEDDDRSRTGGQICVKDNGPTSVGGVAVTDPIVRGYMSQGCADASIYAPNANQAPNSLATIFGNITQNFGITNGDYFAGKTVSRDLQDTDSLLRPRYQASNDFYALHVGIDVTPALKFTSITSYMEDDLYSAREFQGAVPTVPFGATPLTPGGVFNDPQLGPADRLVTEDLLTQPSEQFSQEFRLDSSFEGRFNFSVGGFYLDYDSVLTDFVQANVFTLAATTFNGGVPCALGNPACIYIEPDAEPQAVGHNYFTSRSPYKLESRAIFGEAYLDFTDTLKLTVGARYTSDHKEQVVLPVRLLTAGSGLQPGPVPKVSIDFNEPTGRVALDWSPDLGFTDQTLLYGVISHGYKAGGTNPPASFVLKDPYLAEFVDAIEIGTKNTLMDGRLRLNLSAFHYDYQDYQVTEIRNRTQEIQNIDAKVKGLEFEGIFEPVDRLVFNASIGVLDSEITRGSFVDTTNFTNKDPTLTLVRGLFASTCAVNTTALATYLATNPTGAAFGNSVCAGLVPGLTPNLNGVPTDLRGNDLPNAPHLTVSLGAQYTFNLPGAWEATLRGDYYSQSDSFARTYNTVGDKLMSYDIVNTTLTIDSPTGDWQAQVFAKNVFDEQPVTNTFVLDQIIGVSRIGFVTDPRIVGASLTRRLLGARCSGASACHACPEVQERSMIETLEWSPLFVMHLLVGRDRAQPIGAAPAGWRGVYPVDGGRFEGERLRGAVNPGGADWITMRPDNSMLIDVRLTLLTDDGATIGMTYAGIARAKDPANQARAAVRDVLPYEHMYVHTTPRFETGDERYAWLNGIVAVTNGMRTAEGGVYHVFEIR